MEIVELGRWSAQCDLIQPSISPPPAFPRLVDSPDIPRCPSATSKASLFLLLAVPAEIRYDAWTPNLSCERDLFDMEDNGRMGRFTLPLGVRERRRMLFDSLVAEVCDVRRCDDVDRENYM